MIKIENPAALAGAHRALEIVATAKPLDIKNPTQHHHEFQSDLLAVRSVMRRFRVSFWHAQTICRLSGLGGRA